MRDRLGVARKFKFTSPAERRRGVERKGRSRRYFCVLSSECAVAAKSWSVGVLRFGLDWSGTSMTDDVVGSAYVCPRDPHAAKFSQGKHTGLERSCIQEQVLVCTVRPQSGPQALRGVLPRFAQDMS